MAFPANWKTTSLLLAILLGIAACGGGGGGGNPTGGDGSGDGYDDGDDGDDGDGGDGTDAIQPTLASIQENVFTPICTQCHSGAGAPQGLRLEDGVSYGMLVNVASSEAPSLLRVDPGNPDDSYLIHKLEGTQSVGERMPLGGPYLDADEIAAIRQWISDGAAATANTAMAGKTTIESAWPVDGQVLDGAPRDITVIADGEVDTSLLHADSVQLVRVDAATQQSARVTNVKISITSLSPTVFQLQPPQGSLANGVYELRVMGSGAWSVADIAGHVIDGNGDGKPGGDYTARFTIGGE